MVRFRRVAMPAVLAVCALVTAGCSRPPEQTEVILRQHPGLDPLPAAASEGSVQGAHSAAAAPTKPVAAVQGTTEEAVGQNIEIAAARGETWALTMLGKNKVERAVDPEQIREGVAMVRKAADKGDAGAQYELAFMYAEGRGVIKDLELALLWGRKAAEQGNVEAQFSVGKILIQSSNEEDRAKAADYLQKASDAGNIQAVLLWATVLGRGQHGIGKDEARAESLLKPWAEKGNPDCQFVLAALYKFGETYADRREEAYLWMQRAADQGHPKALEILRLESEETQRPAGPAGPTE